MEIHRNGDTLFYEKTGTGTDALLLFHGFGQDHSVFSETVQRLSPYYTCYTFDLFYHGQSKKLHDNPITETEWQNYLELFFKKENIDRFSLLGFSIGVRLVLATFNLFPDKTQNIVFVAPDGIKNNFWYSIATYNSFTRTLFKRLIVKPILFTTIKGFVKKTKLVHPGLIRFAGYQMSTEEKRKQVYQTWTALRYLKYDTGEISVLLNRHNVNVIMYFGKHDHLISREKLETFVRMLAQPTIRILDAGHNQLLKVLPSALQNDLK